MVDNAGNSATCEQIVTAEDNELPVIDCVDTIQASAEAGSCDAFISIETPMFTDNCSTDMLINDITGTDDASGTYPVGQTEITWTATDIYGNISTCTTLVTVTDDEAPVINCQADIDVNNDAGECGAIINYEMPEFSDNCDGVSIVLTNGLESGSFFATGTTVVTYTATDAAGNTATCSFNVTVTDNEAPAIECPEDIIVENDLGICGAQVSYDLPVGWDNCEVASIELIEGLESNATFPVGVTTVTYLVTDTSGNTATCSFTVTVEDTELPVVEECHNDIFISNDEGDCGAIVNFEMPIVTDNCEVVEITLLEGLESGQLFPIGSTEVLYSFADAAGNTITCGFNVIVTDDEAPEIECPDTFTVGTVSGLCGAYVDYPMPTVNDNCSEVSIEVIDGPQPGEFFELGTTEVTFIATDASGNSSECTYSVEVIDTEAPIIECPEDIIQIESIVDFDDPDFSDNCFAGLTMIDGLPSGSEFPHGFTYVTFVAEDLAGNTDTCTFSVLVNTPPVAENDSSFFGWQDDKIVIDVLDNDYDPDGDDISVTDASAQHGTVIISFNNLVYMAPDGWCGTDTITYVICDTFNACDTAIVVVEVECDLEVFVPEGFSPNGDGVNDTFEILGLELYPDHRLTVFNRWGRKVFDAKNYQNDWDGRSQDGLTLGNGILPEGTYFVVLDLGSSGLKPIKGYVYINH